MKFCWEVAVVTVLIIILLIGWLYVGISRNRITLDGIGRLQLAGTSSDPLTTSPYISVRNLFIFRLIIILWMNAVEIQARIENHHNDLGIPILAFYTVWNWILLWLYFVLSAFLSLIHYLRNKHYFGNHSSKKWMQSLRIITLIIFEMECGCVLLVDVIVWCLLFPLADRDTRNHELLRFAPFCMHTTNAIVLCAELMINNISLNHRHHAIFCVILPLIYSLFTWSLNLCCSVPFAYPFMDPGNAVNALSAVIIFGLHILCWWMVSKFKGIVVEKWIQKRHRLEMEHVQHLSDMSPMSVIQTIDDIEVTKVAGKASINSLGASLVEEEPDVVL